MLFGWNNTTMQRNADAVQFRALSSIETRQDFSCRLRSGAVRAQFLTTYRDIDNLLVTVTRDSKKQVTGFRLLGFGPEYPDSVFWFYSGPCTGGVRTAVGDPYQVEEFTDLYAIHDGVSALLTLTPPVL